MSSLDEPAELASYKAEIERLESELDEQKAHVQSLALEHERASGILEVAADGILTIDDAGLIEYVNPAISEIFGFDSDELIGQNVKLLMPWPGTVTDLPFRSNSRFRKSSRGNGVLSPERSATSAPGERPRPCCVRIVIACVRSSTRRSTASLS